MANIPSYISAPLPLCCGVKDKSCLLQTETLKRERKARRRTSGTESEGKEMDREREGGREREMWAETFKYLSVIHNVNHHRGSRQRDWRG